MTRSYEAGPAHLPRSAEYRILRGPLGELLLRPWYDRLAVRAIGRWVLPLSRAWAAGLASGGSLEPFLTSLGRGNAAALERALAGRFLSLLAARRDAYEAAAAAWAESLFAPGSPPPAELVARQLARQTAAHRFMAARLAAVPLNLRRPLPAVRWQVASPARTARDHEARLASTSGAFPAPAAVKVERSHALPGPFGDEHWLRFASPVLGDTAWARVYAPAGAENPPSLIFLHGLAMENEMWRDMADPVGGLQGRGLRIIRPEGPWHGRRRLSGWYGGEPALGRGPLGLIELVQAWVAEIAVLIAWARRTSRGPVAIGGVSLGGLAAPMIVSAARHWPDGLRPDAAFLVATSGSPLEVAEHGSLTRAIGLWPRIQAAGWDEAALDRWRPLLEPDGEPGVAPEKIVMLLGRHDEVIPFAGGQALARLWGVPGDNLFLQPRGHFSASLSLGREPAPLERLLALLGGG